jgi:hypothetical protein
VANGKGQWRRESLKRRAGMTHIMVDDARGNAEALLQIKEKYDLKINLK